MTVLLIGGDRIVTTPGTSRRAAGRTSIKDGAVPVEICPVVEETEMGPASLFGKPLGYGAKCRLARLHRRLTAANP